MFQLAYLLIYWWTLSMLSDMSLNNGEVNCVTFLNCYF